MEKRRRRRKKRSQQRDGERAVRAASRSRQTDTSHRVEKPSSPAGVAADLVLQSVSVLSGVRVCTRKPTHTKRQEFHSTVLYLPQWRRLVCSCDRRLAPLGFRSAINPLWSTVIPRFQAIGQRLRRLSVCSSLAMTRQGDGRAFAQTCHVKRADVNPDGTGNRVVLSD